LATRENVGEIYKLKIIKDTIKKVIDCRSSRKCNLRTFLPNWCSKSYYCNTSYLVFFQEWYL